MTSLLMNIHDVISIARAPMNI